MSTFKNYLDSLKVLGLCETEIETISYQTKFKSRSSGKLCPSVFISSLLEQSANGFATFNDISSGIYNQEGIQISRQAIAKKINSRCVDFIKTIMEQAFSKQVFPIMKEQHEVSCRYKRILVQDSTIVRLPIRLFPEFSGVSNSHSSACNARIQLVYDLLSKKFIHLSIDSYSKNDTKAAPELELEQGDLILRDRGYICYKEIQRHIDAKADCIFRHKASNTYLNVNTAEPINLLQLLKDEGQIDMIVMLNNKQNTHVRLVAQPVSEELANIRRMNLKKEAKGRNPSKENLSLMSWSIFLVTFPQTEGTFNLIFELYSLRWRIENIFKILKGSLNFEKIHNISIHHLKVITMARIITILLIHSLVYVPLIHLVKQKYKRILSLHKITNYIKKNASQISRITKEIMHPQEPQDAIGALVRFCSYDLRNRKNYEQNFEIAVSHCT